ncbi:uncharacterized protein BJX67DRAFT_212939 [Aspergillus lucknowensis]|uniref:Uncharacterized protein n=1 Tax=Aspergillus lucknowensis TaxID=176173 RepID=A0ABR4M2K6_9EURO
MVWISPSIISPNITSAGLTSRIRLKAFKTIAHGFSLPNAMTMSLKKIHSEEDVFQFIGSTSGHTTNAKDISAKSRTTQALGDLSDNTLQKINDCRGTPSENTGQQSKNSQFTHYGEGQKLGNGKQT